MMKSSETLEIYRKSIIFVNIEHYAPCVSPVGEFFHSELFEFSRMTCCA